MAQLNDFHYGLSLMNTLYGIDMDEDQYDEVALLGWGLIGNKRTRIYRYDACVDSCEDGVELPCNLDQLEAVTLAGEDWQYVTNYSPNGDLDTAFVENYIEHSKAFRNPLHIPGRFIKYEQVGNKLYFDRPHGHIHILYRGIIADDNGLPQITDKEATALAAYCAYVTKYKEGLQTNNPNIIQMAATLKAQWDIRCDQARGDHYITQNEWDEILNAKASWDRKVYNHSYKMYT